MRIILAKRVERKTSEFSRSFTKPIAASLRKADRQQAQKQVREALYEA